MKKLGPRNARLLRAQADHALFEPVKLRLAREARGRGQGELASSVDVSAAAISQYERGRSKPSAKTLVRLADELAFPFEFFLRQGTAPSDELRAPFFRSLRSTPARERARARAYTELLDLFTSAIEAYVQLPRPNVPVERIGSSESLQKIEDIARRTRMDWRLEAGPIPNVVLVLERHGIVTARFPIASEELDAFSVPFPKRSIVVLGADKDATDRSRFDAAHELAHLVMHGDSDPTEHKRLEKQANMFAAAFLMPADDIRDELPRSLDWPRLFDLKARWRVSVAALLRRAHTLKLIEKTQYVQGMKYMSARGWRRREPVSLGPAESPTLLSRAVTILERQGIDLEQLANENGLPTDLLREFLGASRDPRPRLSL